MEDAIDYKALLKKYMALHLEHGYMFMANHVGDSDAEIEAITALQDEVEAEYE